MQDSRRAPGRPERPLGPSGREFGSALTLHTAEEITPHLADLGCRDLRHYGIRSVCDYITDDARKHDPAFYEDLERLELALTARHPYMHTARLFQLTARKREE